MTNTQDWIPKKAQSEHALAIYQTRKTIEHWLLERDYHQWDNIPHDLNLIQNQVDNREWYIITKQTSDTIKVIAGFRLLYNDFTIWGDQSEPAAYLHTLMVHPDNMGNNLAHKLLYWAQYHSYVTRGTKLLRLDCVTHNPELRKYYTDQNFIEVGNRSFTNRLYPVTLFERNVFNMPKTPRAR